MKQAEKIIKWVTVGLMFLPVVMFFLPYRTSSSKSYSGLEMVTATSGMHSSWLVEMIIRNMVPVCFVVIAACVLLKTHIATSIIATILSLIAFIIYSGYIGEYRTGSYGVGFGLEINYIISILGIVLPIVIIVLHKINEKNEKQTATE